MNKRGFLATLAAMCVAPFAARAKPSLKFVPMPPSMLDRIRERALALSSVPRFEEDLEVRLGRNWRSVLTVERYYERLDSFMRLNGRWRPVEDLETIPAGDRDHVWETPHDHDAYVEIRIGKFRQAVRVVGSADPVECVKSVLAPDTLLSDWIEEELAYPDSVLHAIRSESKAAVYKDLAERSVRILPR